VRGRRLLHPRLADDLLAFPPPAVEEQLAELRHVARPQVQPPAGLHDVVRILQPVEVRDAERLEQVALGELVDA
jgi:hypothetical protein